MNLPTMLFGPSPATFRRVAALVAGLPAESATAAAIRAEMDEAPAAVEPTPAKRRRAEGKEVVDFFSGMGKGA